MKRLLWVTLILMVGFLNALEIKKEDSGAINDKALIVNQTFTPFNIDFVYKDFNEAKEAKNFIHFHMESTKLGMITTDFMGVIKKFSVSGSMSDISFNNAKVVFQIKDMDTDVGARNDKMFDKCFSYDKFPDLEVQIAGPVSASEGKYTDIPAFINVRGKKHSIKINVTVKKVSDGILVSGQSKVYLTKLEIPDPSIMIASVNDEVNIKFSFTVK